MNSFLPFLILLGCTAHAFSTTLEFPKLEDARRVRGKLVSADFIHRSGQFRTEEGELIDFTMPPYAVMKYRGSEADLREVPLGTKMDFLLLLGETGRPQTLLTTDDGQKPDAAQQQKFREFTEKRGVAGWITKTEGKRVTVVLFSGDPAFYESAYGELLAKGKEIRICVANNELRTWNPPVDGERGSIQERQKLPFEGFGFSGYEIAVSVSNMLEGFRQGRVVRIFLAGWKAQDQFYGETLMGYGFGRMQNHELVENVAKEYPEQFPFRTDHGNAHLPWFKLKDDVKPPPFSEHLVFGELASTDAKTGTGRFLTDGTGEPVNFALIQKHTIKHLGKDTQFAQLPVGQRYRFHCYQDAGGRFARVTLISDEFSHFTANASTGRVTGLHLDEGRIEVAWQLPEVKDYNGDMQRPPDFGRCFLNVGGQTQVWKGEAAIRLEDLRIGDVVLFSRTAERPGIPAHLTNLWVDEETHKLLAAKLPKDTAAKKP